jgi:hypothetical protein
MERLMRALAVAVVVSLTFASWPLAAHGAPTIAAGTEERPAYGIFYTAWLKPKKEGATVRLRVSRHPEWVRWMRLDTTSKRYSNFKGSGELAPEEGGLRWMPPKEDAWLQFDVVLTSRRASGRYDGYLTEDWALFRADDLVPPIRIDMEDGTQSAAKLQLNLPEDWSVATPFPRYSSGRFRIDNPQRLFDRPTGWILAGRIGTRRETIAGASVTVAAPTGQNVRRLDLLAFLRTVLPTMAAILPLPDRLLVVSADDPMWRGALSAPDSLFLHADRPMISENATSTLVHELIHVAMSARSAPGADWIVEGLAEYYSLEVLRRSGLISTERFEKAHRKLAEWAGEAGPLDAERSSGATTAKAVGILRTVDAEIRTASGGAHRLDDVLRALAVEGEGGAAVTGKRFRELVDKAAGKPVGALPG